MNYFFVLLLGLPTTNSISATEDEPELSSPVVNSRVVFNPQLNDQNLETANTYGRQNIQ